MPAAELARSMLISRGTWLAGHCLLAVLALAVVTLSTSLFRPHQAFTTTALLYLIIVVVLSLNGSFLSAAIVSLIAVVSLEYFFNPPLYTLGVEDPLEAIALLAFLTTALVVTRLVSKMRNSLQDLHASIVERTRAEEAAQRQAALLDLTHDTVFVRDPHDVVTFWNRGGQELYGWSAQEAVGSLAHELLKTEFPAPRDQITDELDRTGRWEGELTNAKRDGSKVIVASRWSLQRDSQGLPLATLETNNDITSRKLAQDALVRAQAELTHVARVTTLGELAASIAHEVNQPLSAIVADANAGLNWLALEPPNLVRAREAFQTIAKDSNRAGQVLTRIRAMLSRAFHPHEVCDLCGVIRNVIPLVQSQFALHTIRVQNVLAADGARVSGDRIELEQVLLNLLLNALDATKEVPTERRRVIVSARVQRDGNESRAVVEVQDSGVGFPEADLARIFEAFYTTKPGGLGMGLSVSRSIIERHGGHLWATANADYGVTVSFALPAVL